MRVFYEICYCNLYCVYLFYDLQIRLSIITIRV
ncbi:hypothetical protein MHA_0118 [Mannheimia haemolytica PHL213]|nr:hypothetical protein MHA_0118 [Mannheimia haemolytica PHL213]